MIIQEESLWDCIQELLDLGRLSHKEIDTLDLNYNPNVVMYNNLSEAGVLFILTMRKDGRLVGYTMSAVSPHMTDIDKLISITLVMYVSEEARGHEAIKLIDSTTDLMQVKGSIQHTFGVPVQNDYRKILERKNFTKVETMFSKHLGG